MEKAEWERLIKNLIAKGTLRSPNVIRAIRLVSHEPFLPERTREYYCYGIDFAAYDYRIWYSPSGGLTDMLDWGQAAFPRPAGADVFQVVESA